MTIKRDIISNDKGFLQQNQRYIFPMIRDGLAFMPRRMFFGEIPVSVPFISDRPIFRSPPWPVAWNGILSYLIQPY